MSQWNGSKEKCKSIINGNVKVVLKVGMENEHLLTDNNLVSWECVQLWSYACAELEGCQENKGY